MSGSKHNSAKGRSTESFVATILQQQGWVIIARNVHYVGGELDLIAKDPSGALVFLEVKSSWTKQAGRPFAQLHRRKQCLLWRAALSWIAQNSIPEQAMRFDAVSVQWQKGIPNIEHLQNAFTGPSATWSPF